MSVLATSVATLTVVTWSYLALARGSFGRIKGAKPDASEKVGFSGGVVAVVPARNEAELIGPVVTSLLNQGVAMPVVLVDDESTDGTADVARRGRRERSGSLQPESRSQRETLKPLVPGGGIEPPQSFRTCGF